MNAVAAALAVLAAASFAVAAVAQHRAARDAAPLRTLLRRPSWLLGAAAAVAGAGLHAVALGLAPVALVQPVGVLAVPLAVLAERRFAVRAAPTAPGARPTRRPGPASTASTGGVLAAVAGVAVFVLAAAGRAAGAPVDPAPVLATGTALAAAGALVALWSRRWHGTARCLARAVAAAVAFGLVSALLRAGLGHLDRPGSSAAVLVAIGALLAAALVGGGVAVQLAYRSGPPSLVLACLTVLDPIVAVGFGVTALGERVGTGAVDVSVAAGGALLAVAGVALLARHHPEARARERARPAALSPPAAPAPADAAGPVHPTRTPRSVP